MDPKDNQRPAKTPARWMLVLLLVIGISAGGILAYFKFFPETVVDAPSAPKPPMHNAPR